ncbi:MAG: glycosyltransferase family 2 protein [Bacteroidetes bacterium]|nr:glycosyltransferase family 2 protein [Bacteroidota bacterium]
MDKISQSNIAILVTCYNRRDKTIQCLKNLFSQAGIKEDFTIEVFLVDDGSSDGTSEAVNMQFPQVHIIPGNGSLYWNRGMHLAWQKAKESADFDYFLWLNDDTDLMPDALIEMLDCVAIKNDEAIICGAICSKQTGLFSYGGRTEDGKEILPHNSMPSCHVINGNCVLVSRNICNAIGILDPAFPHALGDFEYGLRAAHNGFEVVTTRKYIGYCERSSVPQQWCNSKVPLNRRVKALYSPMAYCHPVHFFRFEKKYYGLAKALKHYCSIHLRLLLPSLWK